MSKNLTVVEYIIRRLADLGIDRAFGVPGDYAFPIDDAIESSDRMKWVVCANELNASYAADGYARMADKPAATLLHLGAGLANGLANLHNARRARSPIVNVVGDHATWHKRWDSPLKSDVEAIARPVSDWN
jgi:acetolactate synthase-1/2/3 large subunit